MFFRFSLKFMLFDCGSILGRHRVPKTASLLMRASFLRAFPFYHGFSFFFLERLSSFFLKRRKKDAEKYSFIFYAKYPS